jgi:hypothetical protein
MGLRPWLTRRCHTAGTKSRARNRRVPYMPQPTIAGRWRTALSEAARRTLAARWQVTLEALDSARREYRTLYGAVAIDVRALRKAAQRVHDLEQLRSVLARELGAGPR